MKDSKTLFCSSKFPWAHYRISSNSYAIWAQALRKVFQPDLGHSLSLSYFLQPGRVDCKLTR